MGNALNKWLLHDSKIQTALCLLMTGWTIFCIFQLVPAFFEIKVIYKILANNDWSHPNDEAWKTLGSLSVAFINLVLWAMFWFLPYVGFGLMALVLKAENTIPHQFMALDSSTLNDQGLPVGSKSIYNR